MNNYKKIEQMLRDYKADKLRIKNIDRELKELEKEDRLTGVSYDGIGSSSNSISDSTHNAAAVNIDQENKLKEEQKRLKLKTVKIEEGIELLNQTERKIIIEFYMANRQWWEVASQVGYSEAHCKRLRKQAINRIKSGIYGK